MRRTSSRQATSSASAVGVGDAAAEVELEAAERRQTAPSTTPCRPSAPPVSQSSGWRARRGSRATPSVTIRRVRSEPRRIRKLVSEAEQRRARRPPTARPSQRVGHHVLGEQRRGVGADAEEGRMAERDDAGVAEDQVEREREQRQDRDLVEQQRLAAAAAARPTAAAASVASSQPRQRACARQRPRGWPVAALDRAVIAGARANRPCGRTSRIAIITRVDDEGAELGHVVLAHHVGDAEQQRGEQRPGDRGRAADGARRSGNRS